MLYTKNGSYPAALPHRILLSDGTTRTDSSTFTEEEIADAGYIAVDTPPVATYPQKVAWDGENWSIREPNYGETLAELTRVRDFCLDNLEATDYKVIKALETGTSVPQNYVDYRQALRDLYNEVTVENAWTVSTPFLAAIVEDTPEEGEEPA